MDDRVLLAIFDRVEMQHRAREASALQRELARLDHKRRASFSSFGGCTLEIEKL
jgi:hypothetical protein